MVNSPRDLWILLWSFLLWSRGFELHYCSMYKSLNDIICDLLGLGLVRISSVTTTTKCKRHWGFCISVLESLPPLRKCFAEIYRRGTMTYSKAGIYFSPSAVRWTALLPGRSVSCCGAEDQELPTLTRGPRCSGQTARVACVSAMRV